MVFFPKYLIKYGLTSTLKEKLLSNFLTTPYAKLECWV